MGEGLGLYENFTGRVTSGPESPGEPGIVIVRALNGRYKATIETPAHCQLRQGDNVNVMGQTPTTYEGDLIFNAEPQTVVNSGACAICKKHYGRTEANSPLCSASSPILRQKGEQPVIVERTNS